MNRALPASGLRLRALHPTDQALFCALYGDVETMKFIGPPLESRIAIGRFAALIESGDAMDCPRFFAITQAHPVETVGFCGIQPPDDRMRGAEIGIVLEACARGRGYGSFVIKRLIETAFALLPIDCVWVQYRASNKAAERLFAGAGFKPAAMRPYRVRQTQRIRLLDRAALGLVSNREGEAKVSNVIRFIESVGRDAALRHASEGQLEAAMRRDRIAPSVRAAILARDSASLETLLEVRETLYCVLMTPEPKKAPTKKPVKKPKKAPPKKPAKKPAKPAKKK